MLLLALLPAAHAQMGLNAPAGLAPVRDMEIYSRDAFVVQQKYIPTTDPISGTFTMSCAASPPPLTAAAGVLLDPGGTGNYPASLTCTQAIVTPGYPLSVGYELTFTQFGTEANGDSIVIEDWDRVRIAFSGSALPPVLLVPSHQFFITFKADNDGNVGTGFALRWRRVSLDPSPTGGGNGLFGNSLQFDLRKGALVGGYSGVGALQQAGDYSTALGKANKASGDNSTALGYRNTASGVNSTALGFGNRARGDYSSALGYDNTVSGGFATAFGRSNTATAGSSTAFGYQNLASGISSLATGYLNTASGNYSTAMGHRMNTNNQAGAFMIGDTDPLGGGTTNGGSPDQFVARFRNGYYFMTSGNAATTGVFVGTGGTSWATISDSTRKERFLPIDGPELLRKISGMKLTTWNYKGQRDRRQYGPMAQEFNALFGQDALGSIGCDTLITTQDIEGLTLSAVQALVRENEQLKAETQSLRTELAATKAQHTETQADVSNRLYLLERALLGRKRVALRKK